QAPERRASPQGVAGGHDELEQHQVGSGAIAHGLYGILAAMRGGYLVGVQLQNSLHVTKHARFIIYYQHVGACAHSGVVSVSDSIFAIPALTRSKKETRLPTPAPLTPAS